jgi:hypothetical protein
MMGILCLIGLHKLEITKFTIRKGRKHQIILNEGFNRECLWCKKKQELQKPKEYHPTKYVWTDL